MRRLLVLVLAAGCGASERPAEPAEPAPEPGAEDDVDKPAKQKAAVPPTIKLPHDEFADRGPSAVKLPTPPQLQAPQPNPDGSLSPGALRLVGAASLGKQVHVRGYVVWKYDCYQALLDGGEKPRTARRLVRDEPDRCSRPNFYLGSARNTPRSRSIWVVDVPRKPRPDERKALPKAELANWPKVPRYKVGDQVVVKGTWSRVSPRGFRNSAGLLIYGDLSRAKR